MNSPNAVGMVAAEKPRRRSTEMLSHLGTDDAAAATLDIAARHPLAVVRAAAIDAHMFNAGDSPEAAAQLIKCLQPHDHWRVGLPRLTRDMDPKKFEKAVLAFYEKYPEERPPIPKRHSPPGPEPRSWNTTLHAREE